MKAVFSRPFTSESLGLRGGKNGARLLQCTLLHQYNKAFAVAGHARHVEGRGLANPIAELVDRADDIRIGYAPPGVFTARDENRAGAGNLQRKNTRRAAGALGDLDHKMAASFGKPHRHGQRAIDPLRHLNRLLDFGPVAAGRASQPVHNCLRGIDIRLALRRRISLLARREGRGRERIPPADVVPVIHVEGNRDNPGFTRDRREPSVGRRA